MVDVDGNGVLNWLDALLIHQQHLSSLAAGLPSAPAASSPAVDAVAPAAIETPVVKGVGQIADLPKRQVWQPAPHGVGNLSLLAAALVAEQYKTTRQAAFDCVFAAEGDGTAARSVHCRMDRRRY